MSLRINKLLGWVINFEDCKVPEISLQSIIDKNINNKKLAIELPFLKSQVKDLSCSISQFIRFVDLENNLGKKSYIVIIHPAMINEWERIDNSIDYYENHENEQKIQYLHKNIFPFYENMIVSKTLKELDNIEVKILDYANKLDNQSLNYQNLLNKGLDMTEPLRSQVHMRCPPIIQLILNEILPTKNHLILKPAILTFFN